MKRIKFMLSAVMFTLLCTTGSASAKETTKYTGTVYGNPVVHLMPLGNGDGILIVEITGVVALSGNPPTVNTLSCSGMGLQKVNNNITTNFYCNVKEGMRLSVLKSTDIVSDTRNAVETKRKEVGNIRGIINFHCILRTLELENNGQAAEYGEIFSDIPTIGFSTYGEQCIGHVNQTSTMLVFKG